MSETLRQIEQALGYRFRNAALAEQAVTHRSAGSRNNERLEFLGDAILGMVIAEFLFEQGGEWPEGDLSRLRASLVNRDRLADIGTERELGRLLVLGSGELKSGGQRRKSILADAVEALIGAVYLDAGGQNGAQAGFAAARQFIHRLYGRRLEQLPSPESLKDPKTRLQEWLQGRGRELPVYELLETRGKAHDQQFIIRCSLPSLALASTAEGRSRRAAEQEAADRLLEELKRHG